VAESSALFDQSEFLAPARRHARPAHTTKSLETLAGDDGNERDMIHEFDVQEVGRSSWPWHLARRRERFYFSGVAVIS